MTTRSGKAQQPCDNVPNYGACKSSNYYVECNKIWVYDSLSYCCCNCNSKKERSNKICRCGQSYCMQWSEYSCSYHCGNGICSIMKSVEKIKDQCYYNCTYG